MTHKSLQRIIVIDCKTDDLAGAACFWAGLYDAEVEVDPDGKYAKLSGHAGPMVLLQAVDHDPRVHLDIEADDQAAEVARLERLGATRVADIKGWTVMEVPTGHRFCVVKPQDADFAEMAEVRG